MSDYGAQWNKQAMAYLLKSGSDNSFKRILAETCTGKCLVLGAGSETKLVGPFCNDGVGINISREELLQYGVSKSDLILGDAHWLPFKEASFDVVVCKSTLHHLDLTSALKELSMVLREGGCVALYEPGLLNPIAFFGRKLFPTNIHVDSERPFIPTNLRKVLVSFGFNIVEEEYHYIFVHILPILSKWLDFLKHDTFLEVFHRFDAQLCRTFLKDLCWIFLFVIKKNDQNKPYPCKSKPRYRRSF